MPIVRRAVLLVVALFLVTGVAFMQRRTAAQLPVAPPKVSAASLTPAPPPPREIELPVPQPSSEVPPLSVVADEKMDGRLRALAGKLGEMWTKNPEHLVSVIDEASRSSVVSPPVTLMLAIAHAETNGKILDVSGAGAVGLAQATPVAYLQEGFDGKLFVTKDYVNGSRAYIMKKPLGDAFTIAKIAAKGDRKSIAKAKKLLASAYELRREGVDELEILVPFASESYVRQIEKADRHNLATLDELGRLLKNPQKRQLVKFEGRVRSEYQRLRTIQNDSWRKYQVELIAERDRLLLDRFGATARELDDTLTYEASEYLAAELDERFSAKQMATFLVRHLETKRLQAKDLGTRDAKVEEMTAALYNGGSHNVKRMLAGLISSLPETEKYMKKVPATRRALDARVAEMESTAPKERLHAAR